MIKTNMEKLIDGAVGGEIVGATVPGYPEYSQSASGKPYLPLGLGGIKYSVKVGDPAYGWVWGGSVEAGVTISTCCSKEAAALTALSCVGNEAVVVESKLEGKDTKVKGATGTVTGKTVGSNQVSVHFPRKVLERLSIGDEIQIRAVGSGLALTDYPDVTVMNCGPKLLKALNPSEKGGKVRITVTKILEGRLIERGASAGAGFHGELAIQGVSQDVFKRSSFDLLRIGDLVAINALEASAGPRWEEGTVTIGVVTQGAGDPSTKGPGILVLMTSPKGTLEAIISRKANLADLLGLS